MVRHGDGTSSSFSLSLHNYMASTTSHFLESVALQTSRPERMRSLPMRGFETRDEHFGMAAALNFLRISTFKEQLDRFL